MNILGENVRPLTFRLVGSLIPHLPFSHFESLIAYILPETKAQTENPLCKTMLNILAFQVGKHRQAI